MEILRQHHFPEHGPIHAIFVPIGGGGLIAGVAAYVKAVQPDVKVIGVHVFAPPWTVGIPNEKLAAAKVSKQRADAIRTTARIKREATVHAAAGF